MRKILLSSAMSISLVAIANAESVDTCRIIANDADRLACYDALFGVDLSVGQTDTNIGKGEVSKSQATLQPNVPTANASIRNNETSVSEDALVTDTLNNTTDANAVDEFGLFKKREDKSPQEIKAVVISVDSNTSGRRKISLDSGQVWLEVENSSVRIKESESARIRKGMFGTFYLSIGDSRRSVKVKRIK